MNDVLSKYSKEDNNKAVEKQPKEENHKKEKNKNKNVDLQEKFKDSKPKFNCAYTSIVPVHTLQPHPDNPNKHPKEQIELLAEIIDYTGMRNPIVVSNKSGFIIKGHGRLEAIKLLGWEEVAIDEQDYESDAQEYSDLVADNKIAELSKHNDQIMFDAIKKIGIDNFKFKMLGIPNFKMPKPLKKLNDPENVDDVPETAISKEGDFYELGEHKIICGSSTDINVLRKLLGEERIDLVVTDPPYNVDYTEKTKEALKIKSDKMSGKDFYNFLNDFYSLALKFSKDGSPIYVFHADIEGHNFRQALIDSGWKLAQCLVWVKNTIVMGRSDYHWKHEPLLYGWKLGGKHPWYSDRKQSTVLEFQKPKRNDVHPTIKPIEMIDYLMKNSSREDEIVYDGFTGSGTTLISCEKNNRIFRGCELDPKYVDVIVSRWCKYTSNIKIKKNGKDVEWKIS